MMARVPCRVHVYVLLALALAGCGGDEGGDVGVVNAEGEIVVAALGDSIQAGSPYWDPDPDVRERIGDELDERSQWEHWAARADERLRFRNCGVYGERRTRSRSGSTSALEGAQMLIVQGGINDIAQRRPVEPAAANLREIVRRGKELGLRVAIANVLPWNNGWPRAAGPIAS